MAIIINGVDKVVAVPNVNKTKYKYSAFQKTISYQVAGGAAREVDVKTAINKAWDFVKQQAKCDGCNNYFKNLYLKKKLSEVIAGADIHIHALEPKEKRNAPGEFYGYDDLPEGNAAGRNIGLNPTLLCMSDFMELACTLIHELAHLGGASTDANDAKRNLEAESALMRCGCQDYHSSERVGSRGLPSDLGRSRPA